MTTRVIRGIMYANIEPTDVIKHKPIRLGDRLIKPGDKIRKIGSKKRASFALENGHSIEYIGYVDGGGVRTLLFVCECQHPRLFGHEWFIALHYVSEQVLLICSMNGAMDIRCDVVELASA